MLFRTTKQQPLAVSHWPLAKQRTPRQRHPELVSGSVRGEEKVKARGEMLKQVQHDNMISPNKLGSALA